MGFVAHLAFTLFYKSTQTYISDPLLNNPDLLDEEFCTSVEEFKFSLENEIVKLKEGLKNEKYDTILFYKRLDDPWDFQSDPQLFSLVTEYVNYGRVFPLIEETRIGNMKSKIVQLNGEENPEEIINSSASQTNGSDTDTVETPNGIPTNGSNIGSSALSEYPTNSSSHTEFHREVRKNDSSKSKSVVKIVMGIIVLTFTFITVAISIVSSLRQRNKELETHDHRN